MLAMKGGRRQENENGEARAVQVIGPSGVKDMIDNVYAHSQTILNFPLEIIEIDHGDQLHLFDLDGWDVSAYPLTHRVPCFGYIFTESATEDSQIFDAAKALQQGVPKGPLLGKLAKGEDVTLQDGTVVTRATCMKWGKPPKKLVILGDTSNSDQAVDAARGCDLLVHEATYDASLYDKALKTTHSTSTMAGEFAKLVEAKVLVITHFSSRYMQPWNDTEKVPTIDDLKAEAQEAAGENIPVFAAEDFW
eukprot:CAMPEP_0174270266 /NCGR_PEP_ID=MMETSP0439-20130205/43874_1 /TAXON_ID=0 /ORGANISM="Stereomyxa ramosa, Strain Chinc5" /LENGTH=248 /DNA_ID=CAMNT_0015359493 /DNA_START=278 /DNA_END=1021 /DNA_ORIENTATION=+